MVIPNAALSPMQAPADALGGTPPPPALDNAPLGTRQAPPAPGPQAPDKHSILGAAFKHVVSALEGRQAVYTPDPTTGTFKEDYVPRKPGGLFRDMLAGALVGGAAAATAPIRPGAGALGGAAVGAQASMGAQQAADSRMKNRAQEQAGPMKAAADQAGIEKQQNDVAQAAIAQNFMSTLHLGHNIGLHDDTEVDQHNNAVDVVKSEALKAGGQLAQVDGNGKPGNGPALMAAYNKDPKLLQGPEGFHRIPSISYDTKGLVHKDGKWAEPDGSDPDWNKRATVNLIDLPNSAWGKQIAITRQAANDVAGRTISEGKPTGTVSTTFGGLFGLGMKNIAQMNSEREERERGPGDPKEAAAWVAAAEGADKESPNYDLIQKRATKGQAFLDAQSEAKRAGAAPTAMGIKLDTERLNKALATYASNAGPNLSAEDRATLIQRQKQEPIKGVPSDIAAQVDPKPVPAQFDKGESDPAYKLMAKNWGENVTKLSEKKLGYAQEMRMRLLNEGKQYMAIDPVTNEAFAVNANDLADLERKFPRRFITTDKGGSKIYANDAIYREVYNGIDNLRQSYKNIGAYPGPVRAKLVAAMEDDKDPGGKIQKVMESLAQGTLTDAQNKHVANIQAMMEKAMNVRNLQGTAGSSDTMRNAMVALVPSLLTPTPLAEEKMNQFENTLHQLESGAPRPGSQARPRQAVQPASGAAKPTATSTPPKPDTHVFNLSAWKKANPTGDANAAKDAAKKQGFTVQE